jgi:peptidoglycan DL-endopeptidase CwlO
VILVRRLATSAFAALVAAACVAMPAAAQTSGFSSGEKPFATISRMLIKPAQRDSLVDLARSQVGLKYKLGAKAPGKAFDCSGLVQWLLGKFELEVPRTSREQAKQGVAVAKDPSQLLPGDLLYFGRGKAVTHIGIYVGDGKYVQAANRRAGVVETPLPTGRAANTWWKGVRRLFTHDTITDNPTSVPATIAKNGVIIS